MGKQSLYSRITLEHIALFILLPVGSAVSFFFIFMIQKINNDEIEARRISEQGALESCLGQSVRDCWVLKGEVSVFKPNNVHGKPPHPHSVFLTIEGFTDWKYFEIRDNHVVSAGFRSDLARSKGR
jgi:hypothetical protein